MTGSRIYPEIYHEAPCSTVFICKRSNKKRRGRIISNFTKGDTFLSLMAINVSLLQFGQEENIPGQSIERRAY